MVLIPNNETPNVKESFLAYIFLHPALLDPFLHSLTFSFIFPDESKFGKKLMEKMGWAEGEGLGASGQGMLDPIMLRKKDDTKVKIFT